MSFRSLVATSCLLVFSTGHADGFICPDKQSLQLKRQSYQVSIDRKDPASIVLGIPELEQLIGSTNRPEDRFVREQLCDRIGFLLVDAEMVDKAYTDPSLCPGNTVEKLSARLQESRDLYGEDPYLPIVRVSPVWPPKALEQELSGKVVVEFTVNKKGQVKKARVVESTDKLFERNAVASVKRFKYKPRVENEKVFQTKGVRARVTFDYEGMMTDKRLRECPDYR